MLRLIIFLVCSFNIVLSSAKEEFKEYNWQTSISSASTRLCPEASENPEGLTDQVQISCTLEGQSFTRTEAPPKDELKVIAYNIERGHRRYAIAGWLQSQNPDVVLLSEVDRGCQRTGYQQVAQYLAKNLGMNFVYGVEFVEVDDYCEHGNAILSRYPLGNVRMIRYQSASSRYVYNKDDEFRVGGRMALAADMKMGDQIIRLYSTHLASHFSDGYYRHNQNEELAEDIKKADVPVILGGDFNTHTYFIEAWLGINSVYVLKPLTNIGMKDAHKELNYRDRVTHPGKKDTIIDFIFTHNLNVIASGVCPRKECGDYSDHLPIWSRIRVK